MEKSTKKPLLKVEDLAVDFPFRKTASKAVNGVSFEVKEGESIGIVGESGCGKSVTCNSVMGLLPSSARLTSGKILITRKDGSVVDIAQEKTDSDLIRDIRGRDVSMIFQEPMAAVSPVYTMCAQIVEAIRAHNEVDKKEARKQAIELFRLVGIPNPEKRIDEYPFQFRGGMIQRAMIAMALSCKPRLLIADEPTTALDVTIQAQVLMLIRKMQQELGISLILITHNLGIVAHMVDRIYVMYLGQVVEQADVYELFENPLHPYTQGLLQSIPHISGAKEELKSIPGTVPNGFELPKGCAFHTRCSKCIKGRCDCEAPPFREVGNGHFYRCFLDADGAASAEPKEEGTDYGEAKRAEN